MINDSNSIYKCNENNTDNRSFHGHDFAALNYALSHGIIDMSYVQEKYEMDKKKEYLQQHKWAISKGKDGYWRTYLPDKENGRKMVKKISKEEVEDVVIKYWEGESENPTVREVFNEWNDRRLELKKIAESTHLRNQQFFNRHYVEFGERKIKSLTAEEVEEFLEEQIPKFNLTAKAFSGLKGITKGFLKRAKKRKLIDFNVEELFQELDTSDSDFHKNIKEDYEEVFSEDEMPIIMEYLENNLDMLNIGILLMFITGIRVGELVTLKHRDFEENSIKIRRTETRYKDENDKYVCEVKDFPKTQAGVRTVIIPDDYIWVTKKLQRINPFEEYIFVKDGFRISAQSVRMRLKRVCKNTGVYHKSPHKIRKTYGSILLDNQIDNKLIMGQMGHTDILCTENHYHRNRKDKNKKSQILSSIPEFQYAAK